MGGRGSGGPDERESQKAGGLNFRSIVCAMRMLVIGSCTGDKNVRDCPGLLTQADFDDLPRFRCREAELSAWALPARELYTGWQHRYMMNGVDAIRHRFGTSACSVKIVSAGYGLVDEEQRLVPYEATFQGQIPKWIRDRSTMLGIPSAVRNAVGGFDVVLFLLGKEYLVSIHPPLFPDTNPRLIFLTSNAELPFHPNSVVVPAGRKETRFGAGVMTLKGKMFERLASGLCSAPEMWDRLVSDDSAATVLSLIEAGQRNR
jgi:hypothetical protein